MSEPLLIRTAAPSDINTIVSLAESDAERTLNAERIMAYISEYPSSIAFISDKCIGFIYSARFAPDIIEILNIFISSKLRSSGYGSQMLSAFESSISEQYKGIILVNSMLYDSSETDRPATNFYDKNGYSIIFDTENSLIFAKHL